MSEVKRENKCDRVRDPKSINLRQCCKSDFTFMPIVGPSEPKKRNVKVPVDSFKSSESCSLSLKPMTNEFLRHLRHKHHPYLLHANKK